MQLRANGRDVYGFGDRKTPTPFVDACTTFLFLDTPEEAELTPSVSLPDQSTAPKTKVKTPMVKTSGKSLAQDAKLVTILRGAVEATARDNGWAHLPAAGSAAKRQAPIDPRNYDVKNFPALFAATGLFEIAKAYNGQMYVADKRNKERAATPA